MKKIALLTGLVFFPLLVYPVFFLISALADIFAGERSVIFLLTYETKTAFLRRVLADWWVALPGSYAVVLLMILPLHMLLDRLALTGVVPRLLSVALVGGVVASLILRLDAWGTAAMVVGGVLLASLFHMGVLTWRKLQGAE